MANTLIGLFAIALGALSGFLIVFLARMTRLCIEYSEENARHAHRGVAILPELGLPYWGA